MVGTTNHTCTNLKTRYPVENQASGNRNHLPYFCGMVHVIHALSVVSQRPFERGSLLWHLLSEEAMKDPAQPLSLTVLVAVTCSSGQMVNFCCMN